MTDTNPTQPTGSGVQTIIRDFNAPVALVW
jgi:hypothetical protein